MVATVSGAVGIYTADASVATDGDKVIVQGKWKYFFKCFIQWGYMPQSSTALNSE